MTHPRSDGYCMICGNPDGECTGNQCTASVQLLGGGELYCHDEQHDGDRHHMQEIESYDVNDPDVGDTYRQSRLVDVFWQFTDQKVGDILDAIKESESES